MKNKFLAELKELEEKHENDLTIQDKERIKELSFEIEIRDTRERVEARLAKITLDYSKIEDVEVDGVCTRDYPDFCDAFIKSATYDGREMSEDELDKLNQDGEFVNQAVFNHIY